MTDANRCALCDVENYPITLSLLLMPRFVLPGGSGFLGQSFAAYARSLGHACFPSRFEEIGFTFAHTDLEATLREVL